MGEIVENIERTVKFLQSQIPRCEQHGEVVGRCPYCDRCEHGATRYVHCEPCHTNDDQSWRTSSVTDKEIAQLRRWFDDYDYQYPSPHQAVRRHTPYTTRNFHDTDVSFLPILLDEYIRLRKEHSPNETPNR